MAEASWVQLSLGFVLLCLPPATFFDLWKSVKNFIKKHFFLVNYRFGLGSHKKLPICRPPALLYSLACVSKNLEAQTSNLEAHTQNLEAQTIFIFFHKIWFIFSLCDFNENASPLEQTPLREIKKNNKISVKNLYKFGYFFHYTLRECERARIFCICLQIGSKLEKVLKPLQ